MTRFSEEAFRRTDETPDEKFYRTPRLVTHIDEPAIAAVTQQYREFFPGGGESGAGRGAARTRRGRNRALPSSCVR